MGLAGTPAGGCLFCFLVWLAFLLLAFNHALKSGNILFPWFVMVIGGAIAVSRIR